MTHITHCFEGSLKVGSDGEQLIQAFLSTIPSISSVESVSDIEHYQKLDIDFLVTTTSGDVLSYELKTEPTAHHTGNFFYEYICNVEKDTPGCFIFSQADYWMTFIPQSGMLYIFPLIQYRKYVLKRAKYNQMINVYNKGKLTRGKLLSIAEVCANVKHNARNLKQYVDYDYIEAVQETDSTPAQKSEFRNIVWR